MDMDKFIQEVNAVDWHEFGGSIYYKPEKVADSLIALATAENELNNIYFDVEFAIGNSHCGTYYPAVRKALPLIIDVALNSKYLNSKKCAIDILVDLYYFCPECDDDRDSEEELMKFVKKTIENMIVENKNYLIKFDDEYCATKISPIKDLLEIIDGEGSWYI